MSKLKTFFISLTFIFFLTTIPTIGYSIEKNKTPPKEFIEGNKTPPKNVPYSDDMLNKLQEKVVNSATKWVVILEKYATRLFFLLATINLVVRVILMLIEGSVDIQKVVGFLLKFAFVTGFFAFLLLYGLEFAVYIVNAFITLGNQGANLSGNSLNIGEILAVGNTLTNKTIISIFDGEIINKLTVFIVGFATYIVLILIIANYIVEILSVWILVYAGYFILAFGGSEWTREMTIAYFKALIGAGLRLLSIMFMIGIAISLIKEVGKNVDTNVLSTTITCFGMTVILLILINKVPDAIGNLASSAWGHMSGFNMASGMAASMTALKIAGSTVKNTISSGKSFKAGFSDQSSNQSGQNETNSKNGSGLSYQAGKGSSFLAHKLFDKKSGSDTFNNSNMMTNQKNSEETSGSQETPENKD